MQEEKQFPEVLLIVVFSSDLCGSLYYFMHQEK